MTFAFSQFFTCFRIACAMLLLFTLLLGAAYPAFVTLAAQALFAYRANGSLVHYGESTVGSSLIGQGFSKPEYFWGRPSATTPPANGMGSGGSNLGPSNPALVETVKARIEFLRKNGVADKLIPIDLVTASASGLDPHISPEAANAQVKRVAKARRMDEKEVKKLVDEHSEPPQFGLFGQPRVNVLRLNVALDEVKK